MTHTHELVIGQHEVRKTFVSWSQDEPDREWAALLLLSEHAPDLAPLPIARLDVAGRPTVVMSRVAGASLEGRLTSEQSKALTIALRRLFAVPVPEGLRVRANDPVGFTGRFSDWLGSTYDWSLLESPTLVREAAAAARLWLNANPAPCDWIVDPVVAIGDGNLDNVIWDGRVCRLIDWEEFGVSDLGYEIADVVEHASSRLERRLDQNALFERLALSDVQRERVEHYRKFFACFWLAMLLPGNRGWGRNPSGSAEDQARHLLNLIGQ